MPDPGSFFEKLWHMAPVLALMAFGLWHYVKKDKDNETKIEELNKEKNELLERELNVYKNDHKNILEQLVKGIDEIANKINRQ